MSTGSTSTDVRRYKVLEVLGRGGFGTVYRAELMGSGGFAKQVALKVLNPDMQGTTEIVARLRDEARMLGLLRHRAIVQVDGLVKLDGRWAVVMEYVEGISLKRVVDAGERVPPGVALEIVEEVAGALHVAHDKPSHNGQPLRLMHRDIKPSNIQITPAGDVKLLDFGVARASFDSREVETKSMVYGSVAYMAPERLEFEDLPESDIYALGVTLIELLVGTFPGKPTAAPDKHRARVDEALASVRDAGITDPALLDFLGSLVAYSADDRPRARDFERRTRELRRRFPNEFLKEWAEATVPPLAAEREMHQDELSGSVLSEASGAISRGHGAPVVGYDDGSTFAIPKTGESMLPKLEELQHAPPPEPPVVTPDTPPAPPARPRATETSAGTDVRPQRRGGGVVKVLLSVLVGLMLGVVLIVGSGVLLGGGGCAAMVAMLWDPAMRDVAQEDMQEMGAMAQECRSKAKTKGKAGKGAKAKGRANLRSLIELLEQGEVDAQRGRFGLVELALFQDEVEDALADCVISDPELIVIKRQYRDIVK